MDKHFGAQNLHILRCISELERPVQQLGQERVEKCQKHGTGFSARRQRSTRIGLQLWLILGALGGEEELIGAAALLGRLEVHDPEVGRRSGGERLWTRGKHPIRPHIARDRACCLGVTQL